MKIKKIIYLPLMIVLCKIVSLEAIHEFETEEPTTTIAQENLEAQRALKSSEAIEHQEQERLLRLQEEASMPQPGKAHIPTRLEDRNLSQSHQSSLVTGDKITIKGQLNSNIMDITAGERRALADESSSHSLASLARPEKPVLSLLKRKELGTLFYIRDMRKEQFAKMKVEIAKRLAVAEDGDKEDSAARIKNIERLKNLVEEQEVIWMKELNDLEKEIKTNAKSSALLEASLKELYLKPISFSVLAEGELPRSFKRLPVKIYYTIEPHFKTKEIEFSRTEQVIMPSRN